MSTPADKCKYCQKSGLSLLLLRPSPIATHSDLQAPGSSVVVTDKALVDPLIPAGLTESRPVLRFLREGYVHLYVPGKNLWRTWRVTDNADLLEQNHPLFGSLTVDASCCRKGHNPSGFKVIHIPQAHELMGQSIWLAFSANLWSEKLKARNKANPKAMVEIKLGSAAAPAFKPEAATLKRQILEFNVRRWHLPKLDVALQPQFPLFLQDLDDGPEHMAQTLQKAAAAHPKTAGKELAVVLPDPAGYAAELNALRLARFELAKQEMAKPDNAYALVSLQMLDGLRQSVVDEQEARSWDTIHPVMGGGAFKDLMRVKPNPRGWPEGTRWEPMTDRQDVLQHGYGMGRVVFPDQEARRQAWAIAATERNWRKYSKYLDQGQIDSWTKSFQSSMKARHGNAQERLEQDWLTALHHTRLADYLTCHFDDQDPNRPGSAQDHSPGECFASEVSRAWTPALLCASEPLHQRYQAQLSKSPKDADAWMWHALLGNQAALKTSVAQYLLDNRNDKLHDLSSAFFTSLQEGDAVSTAHLRFGWLVRPGFVAASLTITQSWSGHIFATVLAAPNVLNLSKAMQTRLTSSLMVGRTVSLAGASAIEGSLLRRPLLVDVELDLKAARELMEKRRAVGADALSNTQLKRMAGQARDGQIRLQLATDTVEARAAGLRPQDLAATGAGSVSAGAAARAAVGAAPGGALRVSEEVFGKLLQSSAAWQKKALDLTQELGRAMPGVTLTLNGQIGLLGMWINGLGVLSNYDKWSKSGDGLDFANTADALFGVIAGGSQVAEAAWGASLTHRLGAQAARGALSIAVLQAIGSVAGAASGFSVTVGQLIKMTRSFLSGNSASGIAYFSSATFATGFTATSGIVAWGAVAGVMNKRLGMQGALWRGAARSRLANMAVKRVGTAVGVRAFGGAALGLTGWGLILLGLTLAGEVVAIMLTPTAQQEFIRRTRFGVGPSHFGSLDEEFAALEELDKGINPADTEEEGRRPQSISELGAMP